MYIFQPERYLLREQIRKYASRITGVALDAGCGEYDRYGSLVKCEKMIKLDINPKNNPDIVASVEAIPLEEGSVNSIICNQVLGDVKDFGKAISEFNRILTKDGSILLTESFICELHDEPNDFWRFTSFGLKQLFEIHGFEVLALDQRGGFFSTIAQMNIRYLIDRFNLYHRKVSYLIKPFIKCYGKFMIWLDTLDKNKANNKFSLGWLILARKK
ncbi:MAG: class I SAM-dependent methyltransferase [Patescibacteria group bacterium]|jgi:hypothetical protein